MTDRINALTLVLDRDIREDDIEFLQQACMALKFVQSVKLNVADVGQYVADSRAKSEMKEKIYKLLRDMNA